MVNNNKIVPDLPDNTDESFPPNNENNIIVATDSDSEDEIALDGYEPLPLDVPDDENDNSDSEQDSGLDSGSQESSLENIPPITRIENLLVKELWAGPSPSEVDIKMDSTKVNEVKEAMANISLPLSSIPAWATDIPEDQWKEHLYNRLETLKKSTI